MIEDRGFNKHLVKVYVGKNAEGKRQFVSQMVTGTIAEARKVERQLQGKKDVGTLVAPAKTTLGEYLKTWLEGKAVRSKTKLSYDGLLRHYIYPKPIAGMKLGKLTPLHFHRLYGSLVSDHQLAVTTVRTVHAVVNQALSQAVAYKLLGHNPCKDVELPPLPQKVEVPILTPEQVTTLLASTQGTRYGIIWRVALTTGLRPEEYLALKWEDLDGNVLRVRRTIEEYHPGRFRLTDQMKTDSSRRSVALSKETHAALLQHKQQQAVEILQAGAAYERQGLMFATRGGRTFCPANLRNVWKRQLREAGLPIVKLYTTRHTHFSHLLSAKVNPKAAADRGGWKNPKMLLSTYAHSLPTEDQELADTQERLYTAREGVTHARRDTVGTLQVALAEGLG